MGNERELTEGERQAIIEAVAKAESIHPGITTVEDGKFKTKEPIKKLDVITARDLQNLDIPPLEYLITGFLTQGLGLLGAPPKSYKSYMCLDMALSICRGLPFLGFETKKSGVLYMDLESTRRRPRDRMKQILGDEEAPTNLYVVTETELMGKGFEEQLAHELNERPDIKLVIVDVFKKIRPPAPRTKDQYERDYEDYGRMKELADKFNITIFMVTHTTKMKHPDNPFDELTGSSGTMGSIDVAMVIKKEKREDKTAKLYVTGRDLEEQCYEMEFNTKTFKWEMLGNSRDVEEARKELTYKTSPITQTVKKLVNTNSGHWEGTVSDIINASKYFNSKIYEDPRKVGRFIKSNEHYFYFFDEIDIKYKRNNNSRMYIFNVINVINDTDVMSVTNVT